MQGHRLFHTGVHDIARAEAGWKVDLEVMPKRSAGPPFPDSPGAWLACFRHRLIREDGRPVSPEEFGRALDCSGATVRRWEGGQGVPDDEDLARIAAVCGLTPLQYNFLTLVFSRVQSLAPPPLSTFREHVSRAIGGPYPAIVWDTLFYPRAWNSHVGAISSTLMDSLAEGLHPIAMLLRLFDNGSDEPPGQEDLSPEERVRQSFRSFWVSTAHLTGHPAYRRLVQSLRAEPRFEEFWRDLAYERHNSVLEGGFSPIIQRHGARFRLHTRVMAFPATYAIWEYIPDDELAWQRLRERQASGPPTVSFAVDNHWECSRGNCRHGPVA